MTITAPAGIVAGQKWDAMIWTAPILDSRTAHPWSNNTQNFRQYPAVTGGLGTLNVTKSINVPGASILPAGLNLAAWTPPLGWSSICISPTDGGNTFSLMRLVGGGYEVHDTTAELYKGGSVTVFAQPQASEQLANVVLAADFIGSPTTLVQGAVNKGRMPPCTLDEVVANTTAKSWEAQHGVYVPFRLQTQEAGYGLVSHRPLVLSYAEDSSTYSVYYNSYGVELDGNVPGVGYARADLPTRAQPMHTVGSFFTGLQPEAVLTLDIRFFVEIAPTPSNATLMSLASPSPSFDPVALELYTRALGEMLPGCMVGENSDGTWWDRISNALRKIAPVIQQAGPYGLAASQAANFGASIGDYVQTRRQEAKKDKKAKEEKAPPPAARKVMAAASSSAGYGKPKPK